MTYRFGVFELDEAAGELRKAGRPVEIQPKPLALYVFSQDEAFIEDVLRNTTSGGVTVNNCLMHVAEHHLPFGGVNNSGMGSYHGIYGFRELSHQRAVLYSA